MALNLLILVVAILVVIVFVILVIVLIKKLLSTIVRKRRKQRQLDKLKEARATGHEKSIGTWRHTKWSLRFWLLMSLSFTMYYWLIYRHRKIVVTTNRVLLIKGGMLGRSTEIGISIPNVTDVRIDTTALGRLLGFSSIEVQSAGTSSAEILFPAVGGGKRLRETIFNLKDGYDMLPSKTGEF